MDSQTAKISNTKLIEVIQVYWAWRRLWIATTVLFAGAGVAFCLTLKTDHWIASQGLIVRDEANGAVMRLGRFQSQTEMKAAQETILEMARNVQVVGDALRKVGPEKSWMNRKSSGEWPSQKDISEFADESIGVHAPKGAEFGTTEVIYLDIKEKSKERALELNHALCESLDNRLREVRKARADGVIAELEHAGRMAHQELAAITEKLEAMEFEAGTDLADLRGLTDTTSGGSTARVSLDAVKTELRQAENQHKQLLSDLKMLSSGLNDPEMMLSAPSTIINAHPGLKKLREGLADAQLAASQLRGRFTEGHPLVIASMTAEKEIRNQVSRELRLAVNSVNADIENSTAKIELLQNQKSLLEERLERLARIRATYGNLVNEVRTRTSIVQEAERELAEARASRDAAMSTTLITRIDEPVIGDRPIGPGKTTIAAAATVAGLLFGLGIVFLLTPLDGNQGSGKRWSDYGPAIGRRLTDHLPWLGEQARGSGGWGRRSSDQDRRGGQMNRRNSDRNRRSSDASNPSTPVMSPAEVAATPPGSPIPQTTPTQLRRRSGDAVSEAAIPAVSDSRSTAVPSTSIPGLAMPVLDPPSGHVPLITPTRRS